MNTTTRRKVIAGAAALPLLPGAAYAASATLPASALAQPADPLLAAHGEWQAMRAHYEQVMDNWNDLENRLGNNAPEVNAYIAGPVERETNRICDLEASIAKMVATTPAGLVAQLRVAVRAYDYRDDTDNEEARFVLSALAGAERIAGVAS